MHFVCAFPGLLINGSILAQATSNDACDGITCNNKGFCVPSDLYQTGYWCECDEGWVGTNCGHPGPTVVCGDDEITITIDSGIVEELKLELNEDFIYFGNTDSQSESPNGDSCQATLVDDTYKLKLRAPFGGCGTELISSVSFQDFFSNYKEGRCHGFLNNLLDLISGNTLNPLL